MKLYFNPSLCVTAADLCGRLQPYFHQQRQQQRLYSKTDGLLELTNTGQLKRLLARDYPLERIEQPDGNSYILDASFWEEQPATLMQLDPDHCYEVDYITSYRLSHACFVQRHDTGVLYLEGPTKAEVLAAATTFLSLLK